MTSRFYRLFFLVTICVFSINVYPSVNQDLLEFDTDNGICSKSEVKEITDVEFTGRSYVLTEAKIKKNRSKRSDDTSSRIPPMTNVACHAESGGQVLVTYSNDSTNKSYCGWIDSSNMLKTQNKNKTNSKLAVFSKDSAICGDVSPLSIKAYCEKLYSFRREQKQCMDERVKSSVFDAKLIVNNIDSSSGEADLKDIIVYNKYNPTEDDKDKSSRVRMFTMLQIFDVKMHEGNLRYLVGGSDRDVLGWIDAEAGDIWYSKLTVFFSRSNSKDVMSDDPSFTDSVELAVKPDNLDKTLNGNEFMRYPVLSDERHLDKASNKKPHLTIAFIGSKCENNSNGLCAQQNDVAAGINSTHLSQSDVLFLVDGTNSMKRYYELVAKSVQSIAKDYLGNRNFRFGVSMYGDFTDKNFTSYDDEIEYKNISKLKTIRDKEVFSELTNTKLFIKDVMKDKPEPSNVAVYKAATRTSWKKSSSKFIIHIADHGDRVLPNSKLYKALEEQNIFYLPIAVKGDQVNDSSVKFINDAQLISKNHITAKGKSLAMPAIVTYETENYSENTEYKAIKEALTAAVTLGMKTKNELIDELDGLEVNNSPELVGLTSNGIKLPDGYSVLTDAAKEIYGLDDLKSTLDKGLQSISTVGYIETAGLGEEELNWDYFVAINRRELGKISSSFSELCSVIKSSNAQTSLAEVVQDVLATLTGDVVSDEEFSNYFSNKERIPLSSKTILGNGLIDLFREMSNPSKSSKEFIASYQREVCRTAYLTKMMIANNKILAPYENQNGQEGDLIWNAESEAFAVKNPDNLKRHNWVYKDRFDRTIIHLPLSYLPKKPTAIDM